MGCCGLRQQMGVVSAFAGHRHRATFGLILSNQCQFGLRRVFGQEIVHARFGGYRSRGEAVVGEGNVANGQGRMRTAKEGACVEELGVGLGWLLAAPCEQLWAGEPRWKWSSRHCRAEPLKSSTVSLSTEPSMAHCCASASSVSALSR